MAGEYLALSGGPALLVATEPCFVLNVKQQAAKGYQSANTLFHIDSPAGKLIRKAPEKFEGLFFKFDDPYMKANVNGFGASTAQYLFMKMILDLGSDLWSDLQKEFDFASMIQEYRELGKTEGASPSGADFVAQFSGNMTFFERNIGRVRSMDWPFADLAVSLFATQEKIKTHEHLRTIGELQSVEMEKALRKVESSLQSRDSIEFLQGLEEFYACIMKFGFVSDKTKSLLPKIKSMSKVKFAKGCGAMGADVIAVFHSPNELNVSDVEMLGLKFVSSSKNLASKKQIMLEHQPDSVVQA